VLNGAMAKSCIDSILVARSRRHCDLSTQGKQYVASRAATAAFDPLAGSATIVIFGL